MQEIKIIGQMEGYEVSNRVYSEKGISPTINTCGGGSHEPKIIEVKEINKCREVQSLSRAEQSRAEQSRAEQSRAEQLNLCETSNKRWKNPMLHSRSRRSELSQQSNTQGKSAREWRDMPNSNNGEYP